MPDYNLGKIYTVRCTNDLNLIYVGSTVQPLYKRFQAHKDKFHKETDRDFNMQLYKVMRELGSEYFYIELYENFPCNNKEELNKREGEVIRSIGTLNKRIEGRTREQYKIDNADKIREQKKIHDKIYREENPDKIKNYYQENKEKILERQKEYFINNHNQILENSKTYYEKNKYKRSETIQCECGCVVQKYELNRHKLTKKHLNFLKNI